MVKVCIVYPMFSLVLSMICKTRGSTHFGSFWSASFNGTSSPVSRFFTITHSSISCIVNGVNYFKGTIIIIVILKLTRQSIGRLYPSRCFFQNILFFSQPDWYVEPDQNCTLPLVKNGKTGNTNCLIGNLNILGNLSMHT